jgi:transcription elongation GreA/GreB family factor
MHSEVEKLVAAGKLPSFLGRKLSALEPGTFVVHKSWGGGRIAGWEFEYERVLIDFHEKPAHPMKIEFAAKSLDPVEDGHILAKLVTDPEGTKQLAKDSPVDFVRAVLKSNGGSMYLDTFDAFVQDAFVPAASYKSWWESTKKKLRADKSFVVPGKRSDPLELRSDELSAAEALLADFAAARDILRKAKAVSNIAGNLSAFEVPERELEGVLGQVNDSILRSGKLQLAPVLELLVARDELLAKVPALIKDGHPTMEWMLQEARAKLPEVLPKLQLNTQRAVYAAFHRAFGDEHWVEAILELLPEAGQRGIGEIVGVMTEAGKQEDLLDFVRRGLQQRSLSPDLLVWICRERSGLAAGIFAPELGNALLNALEKGHYDDESSSSNRLRDVLVKSEGIVSDLVSDASKGFVTSLTRRLMMTPVFDELSKRSILARIVKVHPEMEEVVSGEADGKERSENEPATILAVSWESLEARQKMLDELVNTKIPQNKREINAARELGDLRENFEYQSAKDQQKVLFRQRDELEADLKRARGTDFKGADTSKVSIGTIVGIRDTETGETRSFTILGAWDSNVEKGIIAYLTETGEALTGSRIGDVAAIPTEEVGVTRSVEIVSIEPYARD